jgi:hypothetical protein
MKHSIHPSSKPGARQRGVLPLAAAAVLALYPLSASAQNLILNGSFEDPVVGAYAIYTTGQSFGNAWFVESASASLDIIGTYGISSVFYPTPSGAQFCYLADNVQYSVLRQDIPTPLTAGVTYELSFLQSTFYSNYAYYLGEVTVELSPTGGAPELAQTFSFTGYTDWTLRNMAFTPSQSGPYSLRFSSTVGQPGNIDDVRLVESAAVVPEPAACGLAAGLGLLGLAGWRRWRKP